MLNEFENAELHHVAGNPTPGDAAKRVITPSDFDAATAEISTWKNYAPTPLHHLESLAERLDLGNILYKDEAPRFGLHSFKALGGAYAGLRIIQRELSKRLERTVSLEEIRSGALADQVKNIVLTSATDGNHGRSLAWGAQLFGAPCKIYIHQHVSEGRAQAIGEFGAEVIRVETDYDGSVEITKQQSEENGWFVVSDTSWPGYTQPPTDVMAGYGVMVDEICDELEEAPTHLFIQAGVGGLAAAVTARLRQRFGATTRIVITEPELAACLFASGKNNTATTVAIHEETLMAGLSCGEPSGLAWEILREEARDFVTIPENLVGPAMRLAARPLDNDPAIEAGESAVCGLAALSAAAQNSTLRKELALDQNARVLLIGSEGITDPEIYAEMMQAS